MINFGLKPGQPVATTVLRERLSPRPLLIPPLKAYANQLDTVVDPKCPSCGEEPQTVEHWLQRCPNGAALRQKLFAQPPPSLSVLNTNPGSVLALARKILL